MSKVIDEKKMTEVFTQLFIKAWHEVLDDIENGEIGYVTEWIRIKEKHQELYSYLCNFKDYEIGYFFPQHEKVFEQFEKRNIVSCCELYKQSKSVGMGFKFLFGQCNFTDYLAILQILLDIAMKESVRSIHFD